MLTIAISADEDADCLDIETGDATPEQAAGWYRRQKARGVARPCLYASASVMEANVVPILRAVGVPLNTVRLWSAHYNFAPHRCGPSSCGLMSVTADATQFTDRSMGRNLDQSLLAADFFGAAPDPVPAWQEAMMRALPLVKQGDTGDAVRTIQALCVARGHATTVDGAFGPATELSVKACQRNAGLTDDGEVGKDTWPALMGV